MLSQINISGAYALIVALTLFDVAEAATIPIRSEPVLKSAIAVKLSKASSGEGSDIVESLVQKAQLTSDKVKRDVAFTVRPLFRSLSSERLGALIKRAIDVTPSYKAPDFAAWYEIVFDSEAKDNDDELTELLASLVHSDEVVTGQSMGGIVTPQSSIDPNDDPYYPAQGYLTAADSGINAKYAWGFPGGDGAGASIADVELGWKLDHEDLAGANVEWIAGNNPNRYGGYWPHGTAVLGEILMIDNSVGGVGIAPSAKGYVSGVERGNGADLRESPAEAILDAAHFLKFGDVILTEVQVGDANGRLYPVEIRDAEFEAISLAVAAGITVIEPAANGGVDLDEPIQRDGDTITRSLLNRNSPDFRDSGAIMVTMASSTAPHTRMSETNYGSRIDAYAWGQNITTTSVTSVYPYGDSYTAQFGGSSGAAPIVAGAALSIQGMVFANTGKKLSPAEMRELITVGGTPSANGASDGMSLMPNLKALIDGGHLN
ncbi:subtilisin-like protein [Sarocladium strictum]